MSALNACPECQGSGWIPYSSETVNGEIEESFRLCERCYASQCCEIGSKTDHPCMRPGTVRYNGFLVCAKHAEILHAGEGEDMAEEAVFYLRRWLWVARSNANHLLEMVLEEALGDAEQRVIRAGEEYERAKGNEQ